MATRGLPDQLDTLVIVTPNDVERSLVSTAGQAFLERVVQEHRPRVVIIDNLQNVLAGLDKLDEATVSAWIAAVPRRLRDKHNAAVILVAHANKGGGKDDARSALDRLFGSMAWGACADGAVMLDRVPGEPNARLIVHAKSRGFAPFPAIKTLEPRGDCIFQIVSIDEDGSPSAHELKVSRPTVSRDPTARRKTMSTPEILKSVDAPHAAAVRGHIVEVAVGRAR